MKGPYRIAAPRPTRTVPPPEGAREDRIVHAVIALVGLIGVLAGLPLRHGGASATVAALYLILGVAGSLRSE